MRAGKVRSYCYDHLDHTAMICPMCEELASLGSHSVNRGMGVGKVALHVPNIHVTGHIQALVQTHSPYWQLW